MADRQTTTEEKTAQQMPSAGEQKKELRAYEELAKRTREFFSEMSEQTSETFDQALDRAKKEITELESLTKQQADKIASSLRRDIEQVSQDLGRLGEKAKDYVRRDWKETRADVEKIGKELAARLNPERLGGEFRRLAAGLLEDAGEALSKLSKRAAEGHAYRTGEIAGPGVLNCTSCDEELRFEQTAHVPLCPKCQGTEFRRKRQGDRAGE